MKASLWCKCLTVLAALIVGRLSAAVTYEYSNKGISHYFHDTNAWNRLEIPTAGNNCQIAALDGNATTWVTNDYAEALASISFKGGSRSGTKNYELTFITRKGVEGTGDADIVPEITIGGADYRTFLKGYKVAGAMGSSEDDPFSAIGAAS